MEIYGVTSFLDPSSLKELFTYVLTIPSINTKLAGKSFQNLRAECSVFKVPLQEVDWEIDPSSKCIDMNKVANYVMKRYAKFADILSQLYKLAIVAGYASVTNECSSVLQQIDAPRRRSMTPYRECNLTFLYFEVVLSSTTFDDFVKEWFKKPRKLDI